MAYRILFTLAPAKSVAATLILVNLDMVKNILPGPTTNTISLDGMMVVGNVSQLTMMLEHMTYPGTPGGPITAG